MGLERKLRRKHAKKGKKRVEKDLAAKVALFGHLPNKCLTCEEPFDKLNREQVMSWNVVVRQKEEKVNLYCPRCWQNAQQAMKQIMEAKDAVSSDA